MAKYIIPHINEGIEVINPVIDKVGVYYDDVMAASNQVNLTVYIITPIKFSIDLGIVTMLNMNYNESVLFEKAQSELDAQYLVE